MEQPLERTPLPPPRDRPNSADASRRQPKTRSITTSIRAEKFHKSTPGSEIFPAKSSHHWKEEFCFAILKNDLTLLPYWGAFGPPSQGIHRGEVLICAMR